MAEKTTDDARRLLMSRFKGKDTRPELLVRSALHRNGVRFRLHRTDLPGTPDIVLPGRKIAVFVHGCFWHHHAGCAVGKVPQSKPEFWRAKFDRNRVRDRENEQALRAIGWKVATIWECEAKRLDLEARLRSLKLITSKPTLIK